MTDTYVKISVNLIHLYNVIIKASSKNMDCMGLLPHIGKLILK